MAQSTPNPRVPDADHPIVAFDGAITTHIHPTPNPLPASRPLAFAFKVVFDLTHPHLIALSAQKPPLHFHPYQEEYIQVLEGSLGVGIEGVGERVVGKGDGEVVVRPWAYHRIFPVLGGGGGEGGGQGEGVEGEGEGEGNGGVGGVEGEKCVFLLLGQDTDEQFRLDTVFFQNWYGYQDEVVIRGARMDLVQVMCIFDAGGSYLAMPSWIPFGKYVARASGIVVGRWIGGLLGYQPFFRKWTTDWDLACQKMESSPLQRRFADRKAKMA